MRLLIYIVLFFGFVDSNAQTFPMVVDTMDIGTIYSDDTVNITAKIQNNASVYSKIVNVSWNRNSDFSGIIYDKKNMAPGEYKYFKFKVRNIVKRNAIIDRILMISTEHQTFKIYVFAKFDAGKNPEKKVILPQLSSTISTSSPPKKTTTRRPERTLDKADSIAVKTVSNALPAVEKDPEHIVRSPNEKTDSVIKYSTGFLGTPYMYGGFSPEGFDCSGFVQYVFQGIKYKLPRSSRDQVLEGEKINKNNAQPGDLIFFEGSKKNGIVGHVGIIVYVDERGIVFIHSSTKRGVVLSELEFDYYSSRFIAIKRVI